MILIMWSTVICNCKCYLNIDTYKDMEEFPSKTLSHLLLQKFEQTPLLLQVEYEGVLYIELVTLKTLD
jgi:hypothetical protein